MKYIIIKSKTFDKHFAKLSKKDKTLVISKLKIFAESPLHPSLRTKHIQGSGGLFEASVNMDIRLIWQYTGDKIILMLDVGYHDILNKF
ncbi:MAG: cytotoxin [Ruminococcus sp.]|jgi:mRNA-degrading endonuclease YafQ of YafQ-DinJ toxin-antitoxin module|nr:cytotoxin [Ruminococcus sp.]